MTPSPTRPPEPPSETHSQGVFTIHLHSGARFSPERVESDRLINGAVLVLRRRHRLKDAAAYAMLVKMSTDSRLSLDEVARSLLRPSDSAA